VWTFLLQKIKPTGKRLNTKYIKFRLYFSCKRFNILVKQTAEMGEAVAPKVDYFERRYEAVGPLLPPGEISKLLQ